ncbi:GYDIA family GHMP kinase [Flavobacterium dankookense]|uniref:Mevalonate kinase n=1 Tax=Flavobacterium dankookense TaxID=706186 RepID=A0A4R6Q942_9FLAO|nr:GYDIA family GHMP kinase [Flavobacterium dankookense]TDP58665.1 mevalonate kinase [Flavobacterium dankookense]
MKKTFYSNGKLLITSEYVVLDGAIALALPTKFGQTLQVEQGENNIITWTSFDSDGSIWFEDNIPFSSIVRKERLDDIKSVKNTLIDILHEAYLQNSNFITQSNGYKITTELSFPKNWGLGTSSTLINNIAQWLEIDAFQLLRNSFGGSGYDIACAQNNSAILYQLINELPKVTTVDFKPSFSQNIYFVYLNKKQNSREAIAAYYNKQGDIHKIIPSFNEITQTIISTDDAKKFAHQIQKHEIEMSKVLELSTIKEAVFEDFNGVLKSLGAWGGDFILAFSKENPTNYFKQKGFETVISYDEMILT